MDPYKPIPTDLDEILVVNKIKQMKNYSRKTRCYNSITFGLWSFKVLIMPAGCTDKSRPCDSVVFRQWK